MDGVRSNLGWRSSWWMVLWAGAILRCSFHTAQAEGIVIEVVPPVTVETKEVLLIPQVLPDDTIFCTWYRKLTGAEEQKIMTVLLPPPGSSDNGPGYTGREMVYPNCSLRIKDLRLSDTATYMLLEGGTAFPNTGNISLKVHEYLGELVVTITPAPVRNEFESVQLHCDAPIFGNVSWLKDGNPLGPDYNYTEFYRTIYIASLTRGDTGDYQCQASNEITAVKSKAERLNVIYGPDVPVISPNNACNERNRNIKLTCQAASYPKAQYTWFLDDVEIDSGSKLFIENFNESQAGIYVCKAMNEFNQKRLRSNIQHIHLTESCVSDVIINGSSECIEGNDIYLHCTAEGDDVQYSWTRENQSVDALANNSQAIIFKPCHRTDAANYTCHARNDYSSADSDPFSLSIIYGPDPPFINETIDINKETITLTCVAVAFPPTENQWFFNGELIDGEVLVRKIVPENSGKYTCRAKNPTSELTRETSLEIDMIEKEAILKRR